MLHWLLWSIDHWVKVSKNDYNKSTPNGPQNGPRKCRPSNAAPQMPPLKIAPKWPLKIDQNQTPKGCPQRLPKFHSKSSTFQKCNIPKNIPKPPQSKIVTIQRTMIQNCNDTKAQWSQSTKWLQHSKSTIFQIPNSSKSRDSKYFRAYLFTI